METSGHAYIPKRTKKESASGLRSKWKSWRYVDLEYVLKVGHCPSFADELDVNRRKK